jgi:DNA repair protein SbcC/Rad50
MLRLTIQHFRRFADLTEIDFQPGLTIVSGLNGAGKSTIIEALIHALYGHKKVREICSDNVTSDPEIICELVIDRQHVKVSRIGSHAELVIDNIEHVIRGPNSGKAVQQKLTPLLGGLTRDQFESTYVALQGDTAGLVADKADERRKIIESVLQLGVLRQAATLQEDRRKDLWSDMKAKGAHICTELNLDTETRTIWDKFQRAQERRSQYGQQFEAAIQGVTEIRRQEADATEQERLAAGSTVTSWEKERDRHKRETEAADNKRQQHAILEGKHREFQGKIDRLNGQIELIERDIARLTDAIATAEQCEAEANQYVRFQAEIEQCKERLGALKVARERYQALNNAEAELKGINTELESLADAEEVCHQAEARAEMLKQAWENLRNDPTADDNQCWLERKAHVDSDEKQTRAALATLNIQSEQACCPTCNQKLEEHTREQRLEHLNNWLRVELPELRKEVKTHKDKVDVARAQWQQAQEKAQKQWQDHLTKDLEAARNCKQKRMLLLGQRAAAERKIEEAQQSWQELGESAPYDPQEEGKVRARQRDLEKQAESVKQAAQQFASLPERRRERQVKQDELQQYQRKRDDLVQQQQAIGYDSVTYKDALDIYEQAQRSYQETCDQLHEVTLHLKESQTRAKQAAQLLETAERLQREFKDCINEFHREDRLLLLLNDFQRYFFAINTTHVAERATELVQHAVTDQSILGLEFDEDELKYRDASNSLQPIASRLSGGEKALVGLCLRIALAERAQAVAGTGRVRFLVLDEVLSSLDEERRDAVQRIFVDVLQRGVFEHIIMITHLDVVKQDWQASGLEVLKVSSKTSKVERVAFNGSHVNLNDEGEV